MVDRRLIAAGALACAAVAALLAGRVHDSGRSARIVVEWSTSSEVATVGFHVYRATSPDGPFERVTDRLVPSTDDLTGGDYRHVDSAVTAGRTYYYLVEDVDRSGSTTRHGPIEVTAERTGYVVPAAAGVVALVCAGLLLTAYRNT